MEKVELGFFKAMDIKTHLSKYIELVEMLDRNGQLPNGFPNDYEREIIRKHIFDIEQQGLKIAEEVQKNG